MWAKFLAVLVALTAVGGAGYYYSTPSKREAVRSDTPRAFSLRAGVASLSADTPESRAAALAAAAGTTTLVFPPADSGATRPLRGGNRLDE